MSSSIYLVSGVELRKKEVLDFFQEISAVEINSETISAVVLESDAQVWLSFLGQGPADEADKEELDAWEKELKTTAKSFIEISISRRAGSRRLALQIAKKGMQKWAMIFDDQHEAIYHLDNVDGFCE